MTKLKAVAQAIEAAKDQGPEAQARAALQALHDLPEETAVQFECYFNSDTSDGHPWDVQALWEDVIDALLAEKDDTATRQ